MSKEKQAPITTADLKKALVNKLIFESRDEIHENVQKLLNADRDKVTADVTYHWQKHFENEVKLMPKEEVEKALNGEKVSEKEDKPTGVLMADAPETTEETTEGGSTPGQKDENLPF